jgi:hypothetical protein
MPMKTIYRIDVQRRIIGVEGSWDDFAAENGGDGLALPDISGRPIFEFITGDATRMWFEALLQLVEVRGQPIGREYRCDSADVKRFMRMTLAPEPDGVIRCEHELLGSERRDEPVSILPAIGPGGRSRLRCSVCGRIRDGLDWTEPAPGMADGKPHLEVQYTVCGTCARRGGDQD